MTHPRVTNVLIEYDEKKITVSELAKLTGIPRNTIYTRLSRGQAWNHIGYSEVRNARV